VSTCPGVKKPSSGGHAGVKRVGVEVAQHDQATVTVVQEKQACGVVDSTSQLSIGPSTAGIAASDIDNTATVSCVANTETCDTCSPVSMLKYIDVCITSDNSNVTKYMNALCCDSGAEICVIKSYLIKDLPVDVVGQIQLRPFCGQSVNADLVRFTISAIDFDGSNSNSGIDI